MKNALRTLLYLLLPFALQAQFYTPMDFPVTIGGQSLKYPFAGGLNNPQPNQADLNGDGQDDLYLLDRTGNVHLVYLRSGGEYVYSPGFAQYFPEGAADWVILRDFNGDGVVDLFTQSQRMEAIQGVAVFTGRFENGHIAFDRLPLAHPKNIIPFTPPTGSPTQLYISNVDYPAIDDMDCDGDLDILTFNPSGGFIELYANQSVEQGYGLDSLRFVREENCWGGIFENSIEQEVGLADAPGECFDGLGGTLEERHPGSTLLTFDADNDGDKELILGDVSYPTLNFLHNGGDCDEAWINEQEVGFPAAGVPVDLPLFPTPFLADANLDGLPDLLAAPNSVNISEDREVLWVYENTGTQQIPAFTFSQRDFLVEDMIDLGTGASPAFVDYNADGLLDLVVGNIGAYQPAGEKDTRLYLFENTGTATAPAFELVDDDYLGLSAFSTYTHFAPAFGDLDSDGDLDIVVGEVLGKLFYAENTAGPGNTLSFGPWQYNYMGIDVGSTSVPAIADLDRDGLPDLIIGERTGNINFFRNTGTPQEPAFNPDTEAPGNILALGNINAAVPGSITGYSAPTVLDQNGSYLLLVGTEAGQIEAYNQIEGNIGGSFNLDAERMGGLRPGIKSRAAIADLDGDGLLEMLVGNERGGLMAYHTDVPVGSPTGISGHRSAQLEVYPMPAAEQVTVVLPETADAKVYNLTGQLMWSGQLPAGEQVLNLSAWPVGVYWLKAASGQNHYQARVVKQ